MRVVVTRIEPDGTMQRRVVNTARRDDGPRWEDLAARALASPPPYRPVPGTAVYHVSAGDHVVQVGEYDLDGPLRDLVTVVLAVGDELLAGPARWANPCAAPFAGFGAASLEPTQSSSAMAAAESEGSGGLAWTGECPGGPGQLPPGGVNYHTRPALAFQQVPGAGGHQLGD